MDRSNISSVCIETYFVKVSAIEIRDITRFVPDAVEARVSLCCSNIATNLIGLCVSILWVRIKPYRYIICRVGMEGDACYKEMRAGVNTNICNVVSGMSTGIL